MTAVKEQFMQILPQIQRDVPSMPDSEVQQFINIYVNWKPKQETPVEPMQGKASTRKYPQKSVAEKQKAFEGLLKHCGSVHYTEDLENAKDEYLWSKYGSID